MFNCLGFNSSWVMDINIYYKVNFTHCYQYHVSIIEYSVLGITVKRFYPDKRIPTIWWYLSPYLWHLIDYINHTIINIRDRKSTAWLLISAISKHITFLVLEADESHNTTAS